jgi:hypothetical protein
LSDVLWYLHQDDVLKEISKMMGCDKVDTYTPGWFQLRTVASKTILDNMTEAVIDELRRKGKEMAERGLPDDVQRK